MMEGAVSLRFYSSSSSYFIANQFRFHPLLLLVVMAAE